MTVEYLFFHILIVDPWKLLLQIAKILSFPVRDFHRIFSSAQALCEERIQLLFFLKPPVGHLQCYIFLEEIFYEKSFVSLHFEYFLSECLSRTNITEVCITKLHVSTRVVTFKFPQIYQL